MRKYIYRIFSGKQKRIGQQADPKPKTTVSHRF
jgi:hypothetical protein